MKQRSDFEAPGDWVRLLHESNPDGWLDDVYEVSQSWRVPWDDGEPHPILMDWLLSRDGLVRTAERALDVGCGLGYNAEALSARGFDVTAFDISRAAVETCRRRVPETKVDYVQGDLRKPESSWTGRFDLVFEAAVLQVMRLEEVERGVRNLCSFVAPGGLLLTITRLRDPSQPQTCMPWHFTLDELTTIPRLEGLEFADFVEVPDPINHAVRRARLTFRRRASA